MINVIKCPKHLLGALDSINFKKVFEYNTGIYLKTKNEIFYVTTKCTLNSLSVQISDTDLELIRRNDESMSLNFVVDKNTNVVDLSYPMTVKPSLLQTIAAVIRSKNPMTGLEGKDTPLIHNHDILKHMDPISNPTIIVGRGLGLTPSGDDVLIGIIFTLSLLGDENTLRVLREKINLESTNHISAQFIRHAFEGYFSESLLKLVNANSMEETIDEIIKTGHTSGADTLLGIYYGVSRM